MRCDNSLVSLICKAFMKRSETKPTYKTNLSPTSVNTDGFSPAAKTLSETSTVPESNKAADAKAVRRKLMAARVGFFTGGFTVASWAPIIPFVQSELGLEPAVLGALLLGLGVGSFVGMPIAGSLSERFGNRTAIGMSGFLSCLLLVVLSMVPGFAIECAALFLYGIALGCLEVSVNIYGTQIEKEIGTPVMSGLHAAYSIGEVLSAGALTGLLMLGTPLGASVTGLMVVLSVMLLLALRAAPATPAVRSAEKEKKSPLRFAAPRGKVLMLSLVCMAAFLAEGAMLDWSALYIHNVGGVDMSAAGIGYTLFVAAMAISRLTGDALVKKYGSDKVLFTGIMLNIGTLVAMVLVPHPVVLFASLFVMGLGVANVAPILISNAANVKGVDQTAAITTVTTVGYGGLMAGPALLGFIAQHWSLQTAFCFIAVLLTAVLVNFMMNVSGSRKTVKPAQSGKMTHTHQSASAQ